MIRLTADQQKKGGLIAAFLLVAGTVLYFELRDTSPPPPVVSVAPQVKSVPSTKAAVIPVPPGNVAGEAAKNLGTTSAELDPTLRMEAMLVTESLTYSGSGRNIFSANSAPVDIPKPVASARPKPGPPPPPIDLKFFGTATAPDGTRRAFLLHGEDVFLASGGDIVQRRYKVISIGANSIVVEDMGNNNRQTLPLLAR
jgi:hypothetical protein